MYSLRDSIIKPTDLVKRLKEVGQNTVAITDHGGSLGGISLFKTLKENDIVYINGCELYICDDLAVKDKNNKYYHLIALCKNDTGRKNLNTLISLSERPENKYYKPRVDFKLIQKYSEGLIVLSACMAGEISRYIERGDTNKAEKTALKYKEHFGENYYLEIQSHNDKKQIELNKKIVDLGIKLSIPCVVTTDAHYTWEQDKEYQNKYAFNGSYKEDGEAYIDCFIQSEEEVKQRLAYFDNSIIDELIQNTHIIANKCNVEMPLSAPIMPHINTPNEYSSNKEWLQSICEEGFKNKLHEDDLLPELQQTYRERYEYELDSLDRMGFIDYILLVYSYANIAKRRGIARGSGGGSLICYLTNITNIDPIEHGLYFERFIDVGALDLLESGEITAKELKIPDVDLDFSSESCKEVLNYLYNTYGEENVASIGKFGNNLTKGTIHDMCKVFDIDLTMENKIAKAFELYEMDEIDQIINSGDRVPQDAREAIEYVNKYPDLFRYVRKLNGLPKSFGLHACGKVISTRALDEFLPSCYDTNGIRYLQGDMHDVEDVGLVKIDVLGLRTLDQEYDTLELSNESQEFINPKQNYSDPKVLDIFKNGDTVGIFQMSSFGMRDTLKKMDIQGIEDLSVANALFRPGAIAYINNFCQRRKGNEQFEYLHPDLEPILSNTYGIIVFQEQLIEIGRMAGLRNPDLLRQATAKKKPKLLAEIEPELRKGLYNRGWNENQFNTLWDSIIKFGHYSFNKSHASAYGIIAYMTAKQKAYYPKEFYAGLLNSYIGHSNYVKDNADEIINDMCVHKVRLSPFSFRQDHRRCSVEKNFVVYGIPLIKGCNKDAANVLYKLKDKQYDYFYQLLLDLKSMGVDKPQINTFIKLDFFKEFGNSKELLRIYDILSYFKFGEVKSIKKDKLLEGEFLYQVISKYSTDTNVKGDVLKSFKITNIAQIFSECENHVKTLSIKDFTFKEKIATQKELLGFVLLTTDKEEDRSLLYIKSIYPLKRKADKVQFGYNLITQSVGSGKSSCMSIFNKQYDKQPIQEGDIVRCIQYERKGKYYNLVNYNVEIC